MKFKLEQDYATLRQAAYPPIADQLDALWKGGAALEEMQKRIADVKAKYPKGNAGGV